MPVGIFRLSAGTRTLSHEVPTSASASVPDPDPDPDPDDPASIYGIHRSPGRAGHAIVPRRPSGNAARSTQWRCRATLAAERTGASLPARREAAGASSAWSQPFNRPSRDHADDATLGCRRQPRRPVLREAASVMVDNQPTHETHRPLDPHRRPTPPSCLGAHGASGKLPRGRRLRP